MWTGPKEIRLQLEKLWNQGVLPRSVINGGSGFPLRLSFKGPSSSDLLNAFESVRTWVEVLLGVEGIRLAFRDVRHRVHGQQRIPSEIWLDSPRSALGIIGKQSEGKRLENLARETREAYPLLLSWVEKRPLEALMLWEDWPMFLALLKWMSLHPAPQIYFREVDVPGVHTKFIERHRSVIAELASLTFAREVRAGHLEADLGFLEKPLRVRFRSLDSSIQLVASSTDLPDITLDAASFKSLKLKVSRVFILENEINFLSFPRVDEAIALFGTGYGFSAISEATCLKRAELHYWGDIDTHGFAILSQLRSAFPRVRSFLMDRETLMAHQWAWVQEKKPARTNPSNLTEVERRLFDDLQTGVFGPGVRLEQERIGYSYVTEAVRCIKGDCSS